MLSFSVLQAIAWLLAQGLSPLVGNYLRLLSVLGRVLLMNVLTLVKFLPLYLLFTVLTAAVCVWPVFWGRGKKGHDD